MKLPDRFLSQRYISLFAILSVLVIIFPLLNLIIQSSHDTSSHDTVDDILRHVDHLTNYCGIERAEKDRKPSVDDSNIFVKRNGFQMPRNPCGFSDADVDAMLSVRHNCSREGNRVWVEKNWLTSLEMKDLLKPVPPLGVNKIECVIFCVDHQSPCFDKKCLIPLFLRRNSTDVAVSRQLLENGEYDIIHPKMSPETILDAGANCGIASAIFATMFPSATIISVEPSSLNYAMLSRNTHYYPNVIPIRVGLWSHVVNLVLTHGRRTPNALEWGYMVQEESKVSPGSTILDNVQGVDVDYLLELFGLQGFDILKFDIEGSEKDVMTDKKKRMSWLETSKCALVEMHEDMREGSIDTVTNAFFGGKNWEWVLKFGEYHLFKRVGIWDELFVQYRS